MGLVTASSFSSLKLSVKTVQGDHSACSKPPVDIDLKVALYHNVLIKYRNFQKNVKGRF